jgi:hypothetical protein
LADENCKVVRKFIDEGLCQDENHTALSQENTDLAVEDLENKIINDDNQEQESIKIACYPKNFINNFDESVSFIDIFHENLKNLVNIFIKILKNSDGDCSRNIVNKHLVTIIQSTNDPEITKNFINFTFDFLSPEKLRNLIMKKKILQKISSFSNCYMIMEIITSKIEEKFSQSLVKEALILPCDIFKNILLNAIASHNFELRNFTAIFNIIDKNLSVSEMEKNDAKSEPKYYSYFNISRARNYPKNCTGKIQRIFYFQKC